MDRRFVYINAKEIKKKKNQLTAGISGIFSPGLLTEAIVLAHARPKTTKSNNEFAPKRLAP